MQIQEEVKDTKVEDDSFYLLTLAAVAKELKRRGLAEAKVFLAVGLPLTRFGAEKNDFIKYLTKNKRVSFKYENESYHIEIGDVEDGSKEKQHENYKDWSEYREGSFVWADMIKRDLDACILQANDFSGFLELLSEKGYEVKQGKYLAVRPQGMTRFRRCKTLGENYSQEAIVERIAKEDLSFYQSQNEEKQAAIVKCYVKRYHRAKMSGLQKRYYAIPCVAPIALGGFYSFNGMNFYEYMGKKLHFMFGKSIIDRCVRKLYIDIARSKEKYIPVMSDFYDILMAQPEDEAKDIALSLELFVNGSLNIFNHQTNVDVDNRFTVYGIRDLGTELSPITMLVMMESIQNRIVENGKRGKATWLYIDEFHVLLNSEYSAKYLQQLWKKVRKQGGLCTGITQNVVDLLQNYTATTMLANSEFVALLKQANTDSSKMAEVIGVSEAQLRFVTNTASGMGLIKCGSVVIPFDNQISKDTDLYRLYNTNIHEKIAEQKKKK